MARQLILIVIIVFLAGCAIEEPQSSNPVAIATNGAFQSSNAVATITAESYRQTQVANYEMQATNSIIGATVTQQAINQSIYQSTIDAQSFFATDTAIQVQSTNAAIQSGISQHNANAAATGTAVAIELLATSQKQLSDLEVESLRIQNERELSSIRRGEWWTVAVIAFLFFVIAAFLFRLAVITWRNTNPALVDNGSGQQQIFVFGPDRTWQTTAPTTLPAPQNRPLLLPSGDEQTSQAESITISLPDHLPKNKIGLGITKGRAGLWYSQSQLGDILGAGIKGSGKSNLVRSIAYQAHRHGWKLYLADAEQLTFDASVWGNVASSADEVEGMLNSIIIEFDRRLALYSEVFQIVRQGPNPTFVEDLETYNKTAARHNMEILPPILLAWDEINNSIGVSSSVDEALHEILRRNRKPGCTVALFGHTFHSTQFKSAIFANLTRRIAFRCQERTSRVILGNPTASEIPNQPGAAIMHEDGKPIKVQSYWLPADRILQDITGVLTSNWQPAEPTHPKNRLEPGDKDRIVEMYGNGASYNAITREIFGYEGGQAFYLVKQVLEEREAELIEL